jgi:hypothetical protein
MNTYEHYDKITKKTTEKEKQYQFIELDNCNRIANEAARFLLSYYDSCKKNWQKECNHLLVRKSNETKNIYITSNLSYLINVDEGRRKLIIDKHRLILTQLDTFNFKLVENGVDHYITLYKNEYEFDNVKYPYTYSNKTGIDSLSFFLNGSLEAQAKNLTRKIGSINGNKKSNQNSAAQRARCKKIPVKLVFQNPEGYKEDIKDSMLDGYKIAASYGLKDSFMTFTRNLKAGKTIRVDKDIHHSLEINLLCVNTHLNIIKENSGNSGNLNKFK